MTSDISHKIYINNMNHYSIPEKQKISLWTKTALKEISSPCNISITMLSKEEIRKLNHQYRNFNKPTNVLSFPIALPKDIETEIQTLGDLLICPEVLAEEAIEQNKKLEDHWAHIIIHGILHLLGYDHEDYHQANVMENKEIKLLRTLGINNPYN